MQNVVLSVLSVITVVFAYGQLLVEFGLNLWEKPHYQHFPFIMLASGLLFAMGLKRPSLESEAVSKKRWAILGYGSAWLILFVAYQAPSPLLAAVSFIILVGTCAASQTKRLGRSFPTGPWMLLWLLIPPPLRLDHRLIESLQHLSSDLSSKMLDLLGVNHLMDGNTLVLPDRQLFVAEACSGVVSVISIVACAAIYAAWRQRDFVHAFLLMAAAAGWATLLNVVRISAIALAHVWLGLDWAEGIAHTLLAVVTFSFSVIALVTTDWLLNALLAGIGDRWSALTAEPLRFADPLVEAWDWLVGESKLKKPLPSAEKLGWNQLFLGAGAFSIGIAPLVAFAGLSITQLTNPIFEEKSTFNAAGALPLIEQLQKIELPESLVGLSLGKVTEERRPESSAFGEYSAIFEYTSDTGRQYLVSCDYPFRGEWHELSVCYQGIGWRVDKRNVQELGTSSDEKYEYAQLELTKPEGTSALVSFCACYEDGDSIAAPRDSFLASIKNAFLRRESADIGRQSFQLQVLALRADGVLDNDRKTSVALLHASRKHFVSCFSSN